MYTLSSIPWRKQKCAFWKFQKLPANQTKALFSLTRQKNTKPTAVVDISPACKLQDFVYFV